jgi:aminoglycoside 6'-N-acetyltransferase I
MLMKIIDLCAEDEEAVRQTAILLVEGFKEHWPGDWPDKESALEEVRYSFQSDRLSLVAMDENGTILGWIGAIRHYSGMAWELHPLVVRPDQQGKGIGSALVVELEKRVREQGALTIFLFSDDKDRMTSLADQDLYPNVIEHLAKIRNLRRHPFEFYQKQGYSVVGVIPDADGWGKPDILMVKRVGKSHPPEGL